jgi:hypothetical protein
MTEIVKAIAKSKGLGDENFIDGIFETTNATNDAVDELQGKLLDFDKFRSLEGANVSPLAIDEKLLEAIAGYSSKIDQAENAAQNLAELWLTQSGLFANINGDLVFQADKWEEIRTIVDKIVGAISAIPLILKLAQSSAVLGLIQKLFSGRSQALIPSSTSLAELVRQSNLLEKTLWNIQRHPIITTIIVAVGLLTTLYLTNDKVRDSVNNLFNTLEPFGALILSTFGMFADILDPILGGTSSLFMIIGDIVALFINFATPAVEVLTRVLGVQFVVVEALTKVWATFFEVISSVLRLDFSGFGSRMSSLWSNWSSIDFLTSPRVSIPNYAVGASDIDSGTVFRAGEFGKTEAVYTGSNGKTNVANVRQMEQAFYNALSRHSREGNGTIVVQAYLDGEKVYENTTRRAKQVGNVWAKA